MTQGGIEHQSNGSQMLVNGMASRFQARLDYSGQFMQIPPTITIRPGAQGPGVITQDMLPRNSNHTINQAF